MQRKQAEADAKGSSATDSPAYSAGKLRDEIIASQQAQAEFLKWKLILVAGAGSAALGLGLASTARQPFALYLLCLVPFICTYVDLVYSHLMLRILVIGSFLRNASDKSQRNPLVSYEAFVEQARKGGRFHPFALEALALHASTVLLSALLVLLGLAVTDKHNRDLLGATDDLSSAPFMVSGGFGLVMTMVVHWITKRQVANVARVPPKK